MSTVWQAEPSVRPIQESRGSEFRGLRAFEQPWRHLEVAAARGDALELAAACANAGRACLADGDLDEALWHVQRGRRLLDMPAACPGSLALQCELAELSLRLADLQARSDEQAARRLRDDTRDAVFDVVRQVRSVRDPGAVVSALLQAADVLEALGDHSDAETVRVQALGRVAPAELQN